MYAGRVGKNGRGQVVKNPKVYPNDNNPLHPNRVLGIDLLSHYAGQALQGIASDYYFNTEKDIKLAVEKSFKIARAMLKERDAELKRGDYNE